MRPDTIRHARVPRHLAGAPRLRHGLEQWLANCDPARHGLPSQAIVLVRRLRTRWADLVADERARRYEDFGALLADGRRPASGGADADADADVVWFADESELLVCIARDALSGALRTRWWWRALEPGAPASSPGVARWLEAPRQVPRAIHRLGPARAMTWIARWTATEQATLMTALAQAFAIAPAVAAWVLDGIVPDGQAAAPAAAPLAALALRASPSSTSAATATARGARLHQLCSCLADDPGAARTPAQAVAMAARLKSRAAPTMDRRLPALPQGAAAAPATPPALVGRRPATRATPGSARDAASPEAVCAPGPTAQQLRHAPPREAPGARLSTPPAGDGAPSAPSPPVPAAGPAGMPPQPGALAARDRAWAESPMPASIDTRYGGLLFVLNAALQLSLYGDFSMPAQRGIACPPWRLLLLAGRAWCGAGFRADPLAGWLARRDSACGAPPDPDWRLDAAWLAPFLARQAPWRAAWQDGRFRLLHPAGFVVCDVAATIAQCDGLLAGEMLRLGLADPPRVQCAVVSRAAGTGARSGAPRHRHGCPNLLWPYLHARLALALDDGGASPKRRRIASMLTLPARLQDSGDRTDLYFSLAALPLAVRLAGLDRDPGWIPAASCDFRFHFG